MTGLMKRSLAVLILATAGCMEPPQTGRMEQVVSGLAHLHFWDPVMQGKGHYAYDAIPGYLPDILPMLVANLTNVSPTAIYHTESGRNPSVGDVCFLILLKLTRLRWEQFSDDGLFVSTVLDNPVFCIKWDAVTRIRVQARFYKILNLTPPAEEEPAAPKQ